MDAKQAERLAQAHVGAESELIYCDEPPPGLYQARPGAEFLLLVIPKRRNMIGASGVIAVDRESGAVRVAGKSGE